MRFRNVVLSIAMPVFMQPDADHPASFYDQAVLQKKTEAVELTTWVKIRGRATKSSQPIEGWVAADRLIDPLELGVLGRLTRDEPLRPEPSLEKLGSLRALEGSSVILLEVRSFWVRVQALTEIAGDQTFYVPRSSLELHPENKVARAIVRQTTDLKIKPEQRALGSDPMRVLQPGHLVQVIDRANSSAAASAKATSDWIEVRSVKTGFSGFVLKSELIFQNELLKKIGAAQNLQTKNKKASNPESTSKWTSVPRRLPLMLFPNPHTAAEPVTILSTMQTLEHVDTHTARWGRVKTKDHGLVYWQMDQPQSPASQTSNGSTEEHDQNATELSSEKLIARKPFDMAQSPKLKSLKLASASGIFRSFDGLKWEKLSVFKDKNFPIEFAPNGRVFVGPMVSDDHAHNFREWIHWDQVTQALQTQSHLSTSDLNSIESSTAPERLRLSRIQVLDQDGTKVSIALESVPSELFAQPKRYRLETQNLGKTWRLISVQKRGAQEKVR